MPIGTSDGEHFEDAFHQGIEMLKQQMSQDSHVNPLSNPYFSSQFMEDRRGDSGNSKYNVNKDKESSIFRNYLTQDLSKQEQNPMSKDAGIKDIPQTLDPRVLRVLTDPELEKGLQKGSIDHSHEVPYIAGASKDPNDFTTHVDKSVPSLISVDKQGKVIEGFPEGAQMFTPGVPLHIHEQVEKFVMNRLINHGMSANKAYEIAHHEFAQPAEDMWYRKNGIDVDSMNKFWAEMDKHTEKDKGDFPPNLYTKPYPHSQVKGVKHEPTGIYAPDKEWPVGKIK